MTNDYTVTVVEGDGCIIRIRKPILSADEYERREREVRKALNEFGRAIYKGKEIRG